MRKFLSVAAFAAVMAFAGTASAGVTVDLIWRDTGGDTLDLTAPGAGDDIGNLAGCGLQANNNAAAGDRCMKVVWTTDEPVYIGSNSVQFDPSNNLRANFASFFNNYNAIQIPVGKDTALFQGFPDPTVGTDNVAGVVGLFTGAINTIPPGDGSTGLPAGVYTVGTIIWNFSEATGCPTCGNEFFASFLAPGADGFLSPLIDSGSGQNTEITDVVLNSAVANIVPEPGTASLLGLGLVGLIVASRRRNR